MRTFIGLLLFLILFFPLALVLLLAAGVSTWALNRDFYEGIATDQRLYDVLLARELPDYFNYNLIRELDRLPEAALEAGLREVVTPEYLRGQSLAVVDDIFVFLDGQDYLLNLAIDVTPIKQALRGEGGRRFADAAAAALPPCAAGEAPIADGGMLIRCLDESSGATVERAAGLITEVLPQWIERMPDSIRLNEPLEANRTLSAPEGFLNLTGRRQIMVAVGLAVVLLLAVWLLVALIGADSRRGRLLWLGWMLLLPALLVLALAGLIFVGLLDGWVRYGIALAQVNGEAYSYAVQDVAFAVAKTALVRVSLGFVISGGVAFVLAFLTLLLGLRSRPARQWKMPPPADAA